MTVVAYELQRDGVTVSATIPDPQYLDTGRTPDTAYTYRVRALNSAGVAGPWSDPLVVRTLADVAATIIPEPVIDTGTGVDADPLVGSAWTPAPLEAAGARLRRVGGLIRGRAEAGLRAGGYSAYPTGAAAQSGFRVRALPALGTERVAALLRLVNAGTTSLSGYALVVQRNDPASDFVAVERVTSNSYLRLATLDIARVALLDEYLAQALGNDITVWRRRDGEAAYTRLLTITDAAYPDGGHTGVWIRGTAGAVDQVRAGTAGVTHTRTAAYSLLGQLRVSIPDRETIVPPGPLVPDVPTYDTRLVTEVTDLQHRRVGIIHVPTTVRLPLSGVRTARFTVALLHDLAPTLAEDDVLVKVYNVETRDDGSPIPDAPKPAPIFVGELVDADEGADANGGTLEVVCVGGMLRLVERHIGKTPAGVTLEGAAGRVIAEQLDALNVEANTGIRRGVIDDAIADVLAGPYHDKPLADVIAELSVVKDGFDYDVRPVEPYTDAGGLVIGVLDMWRRRGQLRPDTRWEYGHGARTVAAYTRPITRQGRANRVRVLPPGYPDTSSLVVVTAEDADSIASPVGLREAVVQAAFDDDGLRRRLGAAHVAARRGPRQRVTFTPATGATVPRYPADFDVGDVTEFSAARPDRPPHLRVATRIYVVELASDTTGRVTPGLTLVRE